MATPGYSGYFAVGTAGSETPIGPYCNAVDWTDAVAGLDDTHYGDTQEKSAPGIGKFSPIKFAGDRDPAVMAILRPLKGVAGKSAVLGPAGNASGAEKITIPGYLQEIGSKSTVAGKLTFDAKFVPSGPPVYSTF